jgi:hypothetical protein
MDVDKYADNEVVEQKTTCHSRLDGIAQKPTPCGGPRPKQHRSQDENDAAHHEAAEDDVAQL